MRIGAIVVTYSYYPEELFASVTNTEQNVTWYIHHHGNDPELERRLEEFAASHEVDLRLHRVNRGLSRSWNDGLESSLAANNDLTLLLNDDLFFYEQGFNNFISYLADNKGFGIVEAHGLETQTGRVSHQGAACCALGERLIERIGFFDENIAPAYCEDTDYWLRARMAGVPIIGDPRVLVEHDRSRTYRSASPELKQLLNKAHEANRTYFIRKWGGLWGGRPENIKFQIPFNDARFGLKIDSANRAAPYGYPYDRTNGAFSENMVHVQGLGDIWSPPGQVCGQPGSGRWIEGLLLSNNTPETAHLEYAVVREGETFTEWFKSGEFLGTRGKSIPLRGVRVRLTGPSAMTHELSGTGTFIDGSTLGPITRAEIAFVTDGYRPIESFQLNLHSAGTAATQAEVQLRSS